MLQDVCSQSSAGISPYPNNDHRCYKIDLTHEKFSASLNFALAMHSAPSNPAFDSVCDVTVSQVIFLAHIQKAAVTCRTIKAGLKILLVVLFSRWPRAFADEHQPIINVFQKTASFFPKRHGTTVWLEIKLTSLERGASSMSFTFLDVSK